MVLLNASSRARHTGSLITRNQGGGDKKAGFPYQIGRDSWSSQFIHSVDPIYGRCCSLSKTNMTMVFTTNISRPSWVRPGSFYGFPSFP
jgi:hypothetical protein